MAFGSIPGISMCLVKVGNNHGKQNYLPVVELGASNSEPVIYF